MKKRLSLLTFLLFSLLSCGGRESSVDLLAVCRIEDSIILSQIDCFIEKTKATRVEKDSKFIRVDTSIDTDEIDYRDIWKVRIEYMNVIDLEYCMRDWFLIPCQKIQGKRIVTQSGIDSTFCPKPDDIGLLDTIFVRRLIDEMYPDMKEFKRLREQAYNDFHESGYPSPILEFIIIDNEIVDSTYKFNVESRCFPIEKSLLKHISYKYLGISQTDFVVVKEHSKLHILNEGHVYLVNREDGFILDENGNNTYYNAPIIETF